MYSEATALPTEPKPLPKCDKIITVVFRVKFDDPCHFFDAIAWRSNVVDDIVMLFYWLSHVFGVEDGVSVVVVVVAECRFSTPFLTLKMAHIFVYLRSRGTTYGISW